MQHNTTLRYITQHNTQHNSVQHNATQHNTTIHNTAQHNSVHTMQHNTAQHNATQHNTTQHNTAQKSRHNKTQRETTWHDISQHNSTEGNTSNQNKHNATWFTEVLFLVRVHYYHNIINYIFFLPTVSSMWCWVSRILTVSSLPPSAARPGYANCTPRWPGAFLRPSQCSVNHACYGLVLEVIGVQPT